MNFFSKNKKKNKKVKQRVFIGRLSKLNLFRNVPEGAEADISMLPGGSDELICAVGEYPKGWEHLSEDAIIEG